MARARERVGDNPPTLQVLTLYELDITRKRDALRFGMTESAYGAARRRGHPVRVAGHRGRGECTNRTMARSVDPTSSLVHVHEARTIVEAGIGAFLNGNQQLSRPPEQGRDHAVVNVWRRLVEITSPSNTS